MNTLSKTTLGLAALVGTLLVSGSAKADGLLVKTAAISPAAQKALSAEIAAAKAKDSKYFDAIGKAELKGIDPATYGQFRLPVPMVGRELRAMKKDGLLPMLEAIAFKAPARGSHTDAEWEALKAGLVDAVGVLADPKAGPVLRAVFDSRASSGPVTRAAAEAVGVLCADDDLKLLQKRAVKSDVIFLDAVAGLGKCQRPEAATTLATLLAQASGDQATKIAEALGQVGSDTVWQSRIAKASDKAAMEKSAKQTKDIAAKALAKAYPSHGDDTRVRIKFAMRLVKHPEMVKLVLAERPGAKADGVKAIDSLVPLLQ